MSSIKIEVTQEDIDKGVLGDAYACPIARALARMFPDAWTVSAKPDFLRVRTHTDGLYGNITFYEPTRTMKEFMRLFDRGNKVEPTTFRVQELDI